MLQSGVAFLQAFGHAVEIVGQSLQLVARAHVDPVLERTGAELRGSGRQRMDRHRHAACEEPRCDRCDGKAEKQETCGPPQRPDQRLQCFLQRQFHEYQPSDGRNRHGGRQHLRPVETAADASEP
ncbi:hypothetical protein D3C83_38930 [compost metagenome]